jgi:DNA-binding MarR family transcriptional regulator
MNEALTQPVGHELRATRTDHGALRLWLRLLTCTSLVEASVRAELRRDFECTLPRFDLMAQLERNRAGLRMGELSKRLMVTGGNVTGITDQLVKEGLVTREAPPGDRRAFVVRLTPAGRRQFLRMAEAHESWVVELFSGISAQERRQLFSLLAKLKQSVTDAQLERQSA